MTLNRALNITQQVFYIHRKSSTHLLQIQDKLRAVGTTSQPYPRTEAATNREHLQGSSSPSKEAVGPAPREARRVFGCLEEEELGGSRGTAAEWQAGGLGSPVRGGCSQLRQDRAQRKSQRGDQTSCSTSSTAGSVSQNCISAGGPGFVHCQI